MKIQHIYLDGYLGSLSVYSMRMSAQVTCKLLPLYLDMHHRCCTKAEVQETEINQSGLECQKFASVLLARVYKQKDPEIPPMMRPFDCFSLSPQTFSSREIKRITSVELRFGTPFASQPSSR